MDYQLLPGEEVKPFDKRRYSVIGEVAQISVEDTNVYIRELDDQIGKAQKQIENINEKIAELEAKKQTYVDQQVLIQNIQLTEPAPVVEVIVE